MRPIRVLVVDDSVVVRRIVSDVLASDPDLEVVGVAANGRIALAKLEQVNPDVITLDIEMPELDGLATLRELRKSHPKLPVIMFSTLTDRGAEATLDALALGANDYVTKPANVGKVSEGMQRIRDDLIPKIKAFCQPLTVGRKDPPVRGGTATRVRRPVAKGRIPVARPHTRRLPNQRVDAVVIGVSTGGPNALAELLPSLPSDLPVPVLIVQHMPPVFTKFLADRLSAKAALDVHEGTAGAKVEPGTVWIAPGDHHMVVERSGDLAHLSLNREPPVNSCRPAADVLFRSAVDVYGAGILAVVLTGMGHDGLRGCEYVHEAGGQIIVQDEDTSVVWGMPGFVARNELAEQILPLQGIAQEIVRRVGRGRTATTVRQGAGT